MHVSFDGYWVDRPVLVTGATGFIGGELAAALLAEGARVIGLDRLWDRADPVRAERIARLEDHRTFTGHALDLRDTAALSEVVGGLADRAEAVVFHLAGRPGVRHPKREETHADNVVATESVLEVLAVARPAQLFFASSSSVYGLAPPPFRERALTHPPLSFYGETKLAGERLVMRFHERTSVPVTIVRPFNVYGPRLRPDLAASIFAASLAAARPITLAAGGAVRRDMTFVGDACQAFMRLAVRSARERDALVVNVGSGEPVAMARLLAELEARLGRRSEVHRGPVDPLDLPVTQADLTLLRQSIGWVPDTSLAQGLDRFVDWVLGR